MHPVKQILPVEELARDERFEKIKIEEVIFDPRQASAGVSCGPRLRRGRDSCHRDQGGDENCDQPPTMPGHAVDRVVGDLSPVSHPSVWGGRPNPSH